MYIYFHLIVYDKITFNMHIFKLAIKDANEFDNIISKICSQYFCLVD